MRLEKLFANYRIRALLYAGKPDWNLLTRCHSPLKIR